MDSGRVDPLSQVHPLPSYDQSNNDAPPAYDANSANQANSNPSAPPLPEDQVKINLSYDEVVQWWNSLEHAQQEAMKIAGKRLSFKDHVALIRKDYKDFYPREYFPKRIISKNEICAVDYYMLYHFSDAISLKYGWFANDIKIKSAFEIQPPKYEENVPPPSYGVAQAWWNSKNIEEQNSIKNNARNLNVAAIRNQYRPYYRGSNRRYQSAVIFDCYDFYLMTYRPRPLGYYFYTSYNDYLLFQGARLTGELLVRGTIGIAKGMAYGVKATGKLAGSIGSGLMGKNDKDSAGAIVLGLLAIAAIVVAAASAVVGAAYAGAKSLASVVNIANGRKLARSFWRLACTAGAAYIGVTQGMLIGAMVGSVVPGIGTAIGAVIGGVLGGVISAGIGAAIGKYSAQLYSSYFGRNNTDEVLSNTNPEKWNVRKIHQTLQEKGVDMQFLELNRMLVTLKQQKNNMRSSSLAGYVEGTDTCITKNNYNTFLKAVKQGIDPRNRVRIDENKCIEYTGKDFIIKDEPAPVLKGLKI